MRKGFKFIEYNEVVTPVLDHVSKFVPDQSLSLEQIMAEFAYIGNDKISEIVNRGYDGDEDSDNLGVPANSLDFAELHDRYQAKMESFYNSKERESATVIEEPTGSEIVSEASPTENSED